MEGLQFSDWVAAIGVILAVLGGLLGVAWKASQWQTSIVGELKSIAGSMLTVADRLKSMDARIEKEAEESRRADERIHERIDTLTKIRSDPPPPPKAVARAEGSR